MLSSGKKKPDNNVTDLGKAFLVIWKTIDSKENYIYIRKIMTNQTSDAGDY